MDWSLIALAVLAVVLLAPVLWRLAIRELLRSHRRRHPAALTYLRVGYWTLVVVFAAAVLLYAVFAHGGPGTELLGYGVPLYMIAAVGGYRLLMRFGYLMTGSEAYEEEVRDSEERIELGLRDDSRR